MKQLGSYPETFSYYKTPVNVTCEYRDQKTGQVEEWLKKGLYFEYLSMSESYSVCSYFTEHISITTSLDSNNGRNLLIIRDSYGSPCASFLAGSFDNVIMVDPRFAEVDIYSIIEHYNITDVVSLANVFMHSDSGFCKKISSYLY